MAYPDTRFPKRLLGSHGLKAWGHRLGLLKGDFGEKTDWKEWSQEMQDYCVLDVKVTHRLWKHLAPEKWSQRSIRFEHRLAELCHRIGNAGWTFDVPKSGELYAQLALEKSSIEEELCDLFPSWFVEEEFVPKRDNKRLGYIAGEPFTKQREIKFNQTHVIISNIAYVRNTTGNPKYLLSQAMPRLMRRHSHHCHSLKHKN